MERKEFLSKLSVGLAAVCIGCNLASCGSTPAEEATPDPEEEGNGNMMTVNLGTEMQNVGEFKVSNGIILVRLAQANVPASFAAVQVACTHEGIAISYNNAQGRFVCPAHNSQFSTSGDVLQGPAARALRQYSVTVDGDMLAVNA